MPRACDLRDDRALVALLQCIILCILTLQHQVPYDIGDSARICGMDELVVALKLDPLELRLRCYSDRDQNTGEPYNSKNLRDCYRQGAEAFGWHSRNPEPRSMRDGKELVGWGMATGIWEALQMPIAVRIVLSASGHAEISCATSDMHDIKVIFVEEPDDIINPLGI